MTWWTVKAAQKELKIEAQSKADDQMIVIESETESRQR